MIHTNRKSLTVVSIPRSCAFAACLFVSGIVVAGSVPTTPNPSASDNPVERAEVAMDAHAKRPSIMAQLNGGAPIEVTYDTGSQSALITQSLAQKLSLDVIGEVLVGSPAGGKPIPAKIVSLGKLTVGGYRAIQTDAVVMSDDALPKGTTIIIGNNQFPDALITLDFANSKLRLIKSKQVDSEKWTPLSDRGLTMGTLVIGNESIPLYVDSGNPGWLDIPKPYMERLPITGAITSAPEMRLVDRVIPRVSASMDTDALIGPTAVTLRGSFMFADIRFANLGAAALRNARVEIDMPSKKWRLIFAGTEKVVIAPSS
jgi:Aspartyl protease